MQWIQFERFLWNLPRSRVGEPPQQVGVSARNSRIGGVEGEHFRLWLLAAPIYESGAFNPDSVR